MNSLPPKPKNELNELLLMLSLRCLAAQIDEALEEAKTKNLGYRELVELLAKMELQDRLDRGLKRRMKMSRLNNFKHMVDFDWTWPTSIPREPIERALRLRFLEEGTNVILVGAHGLGKTMILKNIAFQAVMDGHSVMFLSASRLLNDLSSQDSARSLERRFKYYLRFKVLALDELGYLSYDSRAADLLFEVVNRRHEAKKPILLTTNLAFAEWSQVFPNVASTVALVDRLTHMADVIKVEGKSYRHKESMERQKQLCEDDQDIVWGNKMSIESQKQLGNDAEDIDW